MIKIEQLSKEFYVNSQTFQALEDINIEIHEGEIFGIIGMSGAGKSTLVRCINLLERPTSGNVVIDGVEMCSLTNSELNLKRKSIGMIFQQFNLLMQRSVLHNVTFPLEIMGMSRKRAEEKAKELLDIVGLSEKYKAYPSKLSGGQKQRVAIARALATEPQILLCDEATSALDPETTHSILELLKELNQKLGITIVIITHEMSIVEEICNRAAILDNGRIQEISEVAQLFASPKTEAAKRLIYPNLKSGNQDSNKLLRIVFDGESSFEPVIAKIVMKFNVLVNIMFANTKNIDGKAFGQIIIQVPDDKAIIENIINYIKALNLHVEEVDNV